MGIEIIKKWKIPSLQKMSKKKLLALSVILAL